MYSLDQFLPEFPTLSSWQVGMPTFVVVLVLFVASLVIMLVFVSLRAARESDLGVALRPLKVTPVTHHAEATPPYWW